LWSSVDDCIIGFVKFHPILGCRFTFTHFSNLFEEKIPSYYCICNLHTKVGSGCLGKARIAIRDFTFSIFVSKNWKQYFKTTYHFDTSYASNVGLNSILKNYKFTVSKISLIKSVKPKIWETVHCKYIHIGLFASTDRRVSFYMVLEMFEKIWGIKDNSKSNSNIFDRKIAKRSYN
jgi:hypothetical protein